MARRAHRKCKTIFKKIVADKQPPKHRHMHCKLTPNKQWTRRSRRRSNNKKWTKTAICKHYNFVAENDRTERGKKNHIHFRICNNNLLRHQAICKHIRTFCNKYRARMHMTVTPFSSLSGRYIFHIPSLWCKIHFRKRKRRKARDCDRYLKLPAGNKHSPHIYSKWLIHPIQYFDEKLRRKRVAADSSANKFIAYIAYVAANQISSSHPEVHRLYAFCKPKN